ncbi:hypothetical protein D3C78_1482010 [compost metagenome]
MNSPPSSFPIVRIWVLPISNFCPSPNIPMIPPGVTRRPAFMRHPPVSAIPRALPASSTARTRSVSAFFSTGFRRIFRPMSTGCAGSTAPRFTSTPIRVRVFTPTGTRRSTISAVSRSCPTSSTTRFIGPRNSISTACASMPWPRCSISIIPARKASGFPMNMADAKISNPSASCRR